MMNYVGYEDFVYIEREDSPRLNRLIQENIGELTDLCDQYGKRFVYMPEVLSYNLPGAEIEMESVYAALADRAGVEMGLRGFVFYEDRKMPVYHEIESENIYDLESEIGELLTSDINKCCASMIESDDVCADMMKSLEDYGIRFRITSREEKDTSSDIQSCMSESCMSESSMSESCMEGVMFSRTNREEIDRISEEVREKIERLKELGVDYMSLLRLVGEKPKLSRLVVTENYHIVLPEYGGMEIEMRPMTKALYFLFLRHPEGIVFKDLPDYRDELRKIYGKVSNLSSGEAQTASVDAVTNPLLNTVNVNCSRIREAFFGKFKEEMAMAYVINGKRGEAKRVELKPDMIVWRCEF